MKPGQSFEFIIEPEKLEKMKKVVKHNQGKITEQEFLDGALRLKVQKLAAQKAAKP